MIYLLSLLSIIVAVFGSGDMGCPEDPLGGHLMTHRNCKYPSSGRCNQGAIMGWFGRKRRIPCGWRICDGLFGSPDLQGKFILGANDHFEQNKMGGSKTVTLTVENIPRHFHAIPQNYLAIHEGGEHKHNGWVETEESGNHSHTFIECEAHDAGYHTHTANIGLTNAGTSTNVDTSFHGGVHDHSCSVNLDHAGYHDHEHDFYVGYEEIPHTHGNTFSVDDNDDHTHSTTVTFTEEELEHYHDAGTLDIYDHYWHHTHAWTGAASLYDHYHEILNQASDSYDTHNHGFTLSTDIEDDHTHWVWANTITADGNHKHHVPGVTTTGVSNHEHEVLAYFEIDKDTTAANTFFNIDADAVDQSAQCPGAKTTASGNHGHTVPAHDTLEDGEHGHNFVGSANAAGRHSHNVNGLIDNDGGHYHGLDGATEITGRGGIIQGTLVPHDQILTHSLHGQVGNAGGFTAALNGNFESTSNGLHTHGLLGGVTDADDTSHTHLLGGDIDVDGYHTHEATLECAYDGTHWHNLKFDIWVPEHDHDITVTILPVLDHKHDCWGKTSHYGYHKHYFHIWTYEEDDHPHDAWGETVEDCGIHVHANIGDVPHDHVSNIATDPLVAAHCQAHPFSIIPPYTAEYWICCVGCDYDNEYWLTDIGTPGGCTTNNPVVFVEGAVYGCRGAFGPGIDSTSASSLCNEAAGYGICDEPMASGLGLTADMCRNSPGLGNDDFFASKESSFGVGNCINDNPGNVGNDDIWGCATDANSDYHLLGLSSQYMCGPLTGMIGMVGNSGPTPPGWSFQGSNTPLGVNERLNVQLLDDTKGGVLCCLH